MKKIVILGPAHPYRGGIAAFNERLASEFQRQGYEVRIETFSLQYPSVLFPGKSQYSDSEIPEHLNINRLMNAINPFNWLKVGKLLRKEAPDIVIIAYWLPFMAPCLGTIAKEIRKNKQTKVLAVVHNMIPHEKRMGDSVLSRYFAKNIDAFLAMSQRVLDDIYLFNREAPRKLSPHPLYDNFGKSMGKREAKKVLGLDEECNYLLFFGIIRKYKGLDLLLKAFSHLDRKELNVKLIVAGEFYTDQAPYIELIEQLGLSDEVLLHTTFIPNERVAQYFCACDLVTQPYLNATQSGVTQIAYHFEKPMLVTNVGGLAEIVPHGKVGYVSAVDEHEIAICIGDFYYNHREEEFIKHIQVEKKKYEWDVMARAILGMC